MLKIHPTIPNSKNDSFFQDSKGFSITVHSAIDHVYIHFKTHGGIVNTRCIPDTFSILEERFPEVLKTECFNDENVPFIHEVTQTEIGHLFEHILIQYIQELTPSIPGEPEKFISGRTDWNWERDEYGTFHIIITPADVHSEVFKEALSRSTILMKELMNFTELPMSAIV